MVHQLRGDLEGVRETADSLISLATEHGYQQWLGFGRILDGWVQAEQERGTAAIARLRGAIAAYRAGGNEHCVPWFLSLLAAAHLTRGDSAEGLDTIAAALEIADSTGARLWDAELHRLEGELLLKRDPRAEPAAEAAFRHAIDIARRQSAKSWELRAAMSLSRLWQHQGKGDDAARLLGEIHGWFTEGFDTADLQEARALLNELVS
jgi:predicted ATPase